MDAHTLARMRRLRWSSYGLLVLAFMLAYFHRMAPAVLATELQQAFNASGAALGVLAAAYFLTYTAMQIPSGIFADTLGARRVVALGSLAAGLGALSFALADTLALAVLGRLLVGFGVSVAFIATLKIASQWFYDHQFATIAGLTILFGNLGAVSSATPLSWALGFTGWRNIFLALAVVSFLLAALIFLLVRDRPRDVGLPSMRELEGKPDHAAHQDHWLAGLREVLGNRRTWPGFFASVGQGGMTFAFAGLWAFPYLRDVHGMDQTVAAHHISIVLLGFAAGAMALGALSDRLRLRRPVILVNMVLCALCWVPLLAGWTMPLAASYALFALLGFTATGYTLTLASTKEVNRPALSGMATGVVNGGTFLGTVILQPLVGWAMDLGWDGRAVDGARVYSLANYQVGLGLLVGALVIGFLFALWIRETHCRYVTPPSPVGRISGNAA